MHFSLMPHVTGGGGGGITHKRGGYAGLGGINLGFLVSLMVFQANSNNFSRQVSFTVAHQGI